MTSHWLGIALTAGAASCWSLGGIIIRSVEAGAWEIIFWRSAFMAITLVLYLAAREGRALPKAFVRIGGAGVLVALLFAAAFILFVASITRTSVAHTLVIMSASPMVSALLAWPLLGEPVRPRTWAILAAAFAGIVVMFADSLDGGALIGNALAAGVALAMGCNTVVLRHARAVDMVPAVCLGGALTALATWPLGAPFAVVGRDLALLALMGVVQLGLALILFVNGVKHLPAAEVGLLTLLETVLAPLWVWIGVGERPSTLALGGGAIVIVSLVLHALSGGRRSKPPVGMA